MKKTILVLFLFAASCLEIGCAGSSGGGGSSGGATASTPSQSNVVFTIQVGGVNGLQGVYGYNIATFDMANVNNDNQSGDPITTNGQQIYQTTGKLLNFALGVHPGTNVVCFNILSNGVQIGTACVNPGQSYSVACQNGACQ